MKNEILSFSELQELKKTHKINEDVETVRTFNIPNFVSKMKKQETSIYISKIDKENKYDNFDYSLESVTITWNIDIDFNKHGIDGIYQKIFSIEFLINFENIETEEESTEKFNITDPELIEIKRYSDDDTTCQLYPTEFEYNYSTKKCVVYF
jgi:hypothetical protein